MKNHFVFPQVGDANITRGVSGNCSALNPSAQLEWFTCTSSRGQSILMISGAAPLSVYEALLRTVLYSIEATEPDKTEPFRILEVSAKNLVASPDDS